MSDATKPPHGGRDVEDRRLTHLARRALDRRRGVLAPPSEPASKIDDELLLRYLDGTLSSKEREDLERRLIADLDARERVTLIAGGLMDAGIAAPTAEPSLVERVARTVFHVASGMLDVLRGGEDLQPLAAAAVRGGGAQAATTGGYALERRFETPQGPLSARFELHADQPAPGADAGGALVDLVVHVGDSAAAVEGVRCKLIRDGRPIDSREVEAQGCTFTRLAPARYDVELRKGGVEIGRILFDLRG